MKWIYISPHLDDAVYSCGGFIWEQVHAGESVEIWTICAGDPPPAPFSDFVIAIHRRWGTGDHSMPARRKEDLDACRALGVTAVHFDIPDCIYRRNPLTGEPIILREEDLWQPTLPVEYPLVEQIYRQIKYRLPGGAKLVSPLGMGGHMDHHLVRTALERLDQPLYYYADYPYAADERVKIEDWLCGTCKPYDQPIRPDALEAWKQAVAAYRSQISTFWGGIPELRSALDDYLKKGGGTRLWTSIPPSVDETDR